MSVVSTSRAPSARDPEAGVLKFSDGDFRRISEILEAETGIHLTEAKRPMVYSRISKRLLALKLTSFSEYCNLIDSGAEVAERQNMINQLTTNVTRFYREPHHFESLQTDLEGALGAAIRAGKRVRIWSAACSSGEEAYSAALTLLSVLPDAASLDVKILATDIDRKVIEKASLGVYSSQDMAPVPDVLRRKYFDPIDRTKAEWRAKDELKSLITFRNLNLVKPWPMRGLFDVIICRNVVIYFGDATQRELWSRFSEILVPGGKLFIGHSERVTGPAESRLRVIGQTSYQSIGK